MMKKYLICTIVALFLLAPIVGYSVSFRKKDDRGFYYFICDGYSSEKVRIKLISKNTYKALSAYIGRVIHAESPYLAAEKLCKEEEARDNRSRGK